MQYLQLKVALLYCNQIIASITMFWLKQLQVSDMYLKVTLLALLFFNFTGLATFVLSFNLLIVLFGKRIFAAFLDFFSDKYNEVSDSMKVELFKELNDTQPGEKVIFFSLKHLQSLKYNHMLIVNICVQISILEVGGGSGCNFKYWNRPASVMVKVIFKKRQSANNPFLSRWLSQIPILSPSSTKTEQSSPNWTSRT